MKKSPATEAHRVATDIAAIKSALQQQGYTTRKRPKQAAWTIIPLNQRGTGRKPQECYLLTYQPAPVSTWILHLQTLLTLIHTALAKQPTTRKIS
ncbi:MAG: hypothetical protein RIM23_20080 [Coleofasciculus sp. G3-WIS-01]|uniref:hypothetical protein n=1 Tax=Coleofasciculus sp. G3-WIS-01 TaxID=3069528 RepID=UPI0032F8E9F7